MLKFSGRFFSILICASLMQTSGENLFFCSGKFYKGSLDVSVQSFHLKQLGQRPRNWPRFTSYSVTEVTVQLSAGVPETAPYSLVHYWGGLCDGVQLELIPDPEIRPKNGKN